MSHLRLERVWSGVLKDVSAELEAGVHVIIGADSDGSGQLIELCAGVRAPRRGAIEVDGVSPSGSPVCRRAIASLLPNEECAPGGRIEGWLSELGARLGFAPGPVLEDAGVDPRRTLASLSAGERRRIACHIALSRESPRLVALYEPLPALGPDGRSAALQRIGELGKTSVVIVTASSLADARELGGSTFRLDRGLLAPAPGGAWPGSAAPGLDVWLEVDADAPRALVSALAQHPDVRELAYAESGAGRVRVRGAELERLAEAIARAALSAQVDIRSLRACGEDLEVGRAGATGLAHAAYRAAQAPRRAPVPAARPGGAAAETPPDGRNPSDPTP
jgi:ABC-type thiamine transport system ATPase subunit